MVQMKSSFLFWKVSKQYIIRKRLQNLYYHSRISIVPQSRFNAFLSLIRCLQAMFEFFISWIRTKIVVGDQCTWHSWLLTTACFQARSQTNPLHILLTRYLLFYEMFIPYNVLVVYIILLATYYVTPGTAMMVLW